MIIPALCALALLVFSYLLYPSPHNLEKTTPTLEGKKFSSTYWIYISAISLVALGYADFALIAFHFQKATIMAPQWIPLLYAFAMAVEGISALLLGKFFDIKGIYPLTFVVAITAFFAPLGFSTHLSFIFLGMLLWGIGMGAQESIMRALVATLITPEKRGTAYGIMHFFFRLFLVFRKRYHGYALRCLSFFSNFVFHDCPTAFCPLICLD